MKHVFRHLFVLILVIGSLLHASPVSVVASRDSLASVEDMVQPRVRTSPPDLFEAEHRDAMGAIVNEARLFGVPLTLRAVSVPASLSLLPDSQVLSGATPADQELVQRMANEWLIAEQQSLLEQDIQPRIETDEMILLLVVIPEDDPTRSVAAFATGENALPVNGLTQGSLDRILDEVMYPFFWANAVPDGIRSGISYLSYDNLFGEPARLERTENQERLASITETALTGGTLVSILALGGLLLWIKRRSHSGSEPDSHSLSPFAAAALERGRVDDAVMTGALLHLIQVRAIIPQQNRAYTVDPDAHVDDPFANEVMSRLLAESDKDGSIPAHALRRQEDVLATAKKSLEDDLSRRGLLNPDARVESVWALIGCGVVAAVAVFLLSPGMASFSRLAIFTAGFAFLVILCAIVWISRRSWTTPQGAATLRHWQGSDPTPHDMAIFDMIVHQDELVTGIGGPETTAPVRMVRDLRALGPG